MTGAQIGIAKAIRDGGADYLLWVKDNPPGLVQSFLLAQTGAGGALSPSSRAERCGAGRDCAAARHARSHRALIRRSGCHRAVTTVVTMETGGAGHEPPVSNWQVGERPQRMDDCGNSAREGRSAIRLDLRGSPYMLG